MLAVFFRVFSNLDHEHVCAFRLVQSSFNQRLPAVGGVLLVRFFVAKARVGVQGIAEGACLWMDGLLLLVVVVVQGTCEGGRRLVVHQ